MRREVGLAVAWVACLVALASRLDAAAVAPFGDAIHYVRMAREGVFSADEQGERGSPYAYRLAYPALVGAAARLFGVGVQRAYAAGALVCAALLGLAALFVARSLGAGLRECGLVALAVFLDPFLVRLPLFFPTLVDVAAYPLMLVLVWQLFAGRYAGVALGACAGAFFKEFLVVPGLAALLLLARRAVRGEERRRSVLQLAATGSALLAAVLLPRLLIPVTYTLQPVDPLLVPATLRPQHVAVYLLDPRRLVNVALALCLGAAPLLLALDAPRWARLREWLARDSRAPAALLLLAGIALLALLGGTNIAIFCSYAFPLWVIGLSLALSRGVSWLEAGALAAALVWLHRVLEPAPDPAADLPGFVDFFAPHGERIAPGVLRRAGELAALSLAAGWLRRARGVAAPRLP